MLGHDVDLEEVRAKLEPWLRTRMPQVSDVTIARLERSGAGFTNVSIAFTLAWREGGVERTAGMVFRGAGRSEPVYPDAKLERQFRVMRCLEGTAVPVPKVHWLEPDAALFGFPFYVMSRVEGLVPSEFPPYHSFGLCLDAPPERRARMWWGTLGAMAEIHKLDWRRLGLDFLGVPPAGSGPLERELAYWAHYLDWAREEPQPILAAALEWLRAERYAPERTTLCWGDARLPNTMFSPAGDVVAVLDWDMAVLGDPEWDLSFLLALDWLLGEGTGVPRLEGFPGRDETIARWEELTGWKVRHFAYNEVFSTLRAAIVILRVQKNLLRMGIALPGENPVLDNMCTRRLAELLGLPPPGAAAGGGPGREDASGTVQLCLTGPGGGDWIVVAERGQVGRRPGRAERPDATVSIAAAEWEAIRRGATNPFNAWTTGKLAVAGDSALYQRLADAIVKAWDGEGTNGEEGK